jgi:hypothetical protein
MDSPQVGDWVRTKEGHQGKILVIARLSAFIEVQRHDEMRTHQYLLSELTKVEPSTNLTSNSGGGCRLSGSRVLRPAAHGGVFHARFNVGTCQASSRTSS